MKRNRAHLLPGDELTMKRIRAHLLPGDESKESDRLSELPDEIIHEILERLSPEETAKSTILSRRWIHIWRSFPILEFHSGDDYYSPKLRSFVAAASKKMDRIKAVRISSVLREFMGDVLDLIVNSEPEEIDINVDIAHWYDQFLDSPLIINNPRLRILKLSCCNLWKCPFTNHLDVMMINLCVLHLYCCCSSDELVLNALIAGAPQLEDLKLWDCCTMRRLNICNKPNLKIVEIRNMIFLELVEITGTKSLQVLSITGSSLYMPATGGGGLDISASALSSIKSLKIEDANFLTADVVDGLISKLPSPQSLSVWLFGDVCKADNRVRRSWKLLLDLHFSLSFHLAEISFCPRLVDFHYHGDTVDVHLDRDT